MSWLIAASITGGLITLTLVITIIVDYLSTTQCLIIAKIVIIFLVTILSHEIIVIRARVKGRYK